MGTGMKLYYDNATTIHDELRLHDRESAMDSDNLSVCCVGQLGPSCMLLRLGGEAMTQCPTQTKNWQRWNKREEHCSRIGIEQSSLYIGTYVANVPASQDAGMNERCLEWFMMVATRLYRTQVPLPGARCWWPLPLQHQRLQSGN